MTAPFIIAIRNTLKNVINSFIGRNEDEYETNSVHCIFQSAEGNLHTISMNIDFNKDPNQKTFRANCSLARYAIICYLKGYIVHHEHSVKQDNEDPLALLQIASMVDKSFQDLFDVCAFVKYYDYDSIYDKEISRQEYMAVLDAVNAVAAFPPISALRDEYSQKYDYPLYPVEESWYDYYKANKFQEKTIFDCLKETAIECGTGWYGLIAAVLYECNAYNIENANNPCLIIKASEKFGMLQFTLSGNFPDYLQSFIIKTQYASRCICENCGAQGILCIYKRKRKTLCLNCMKKDTLLQYGCNDKDGFIDFLDKQYFDCGIGWFGIIMHVVVKLKEYCFFHPKIPVEKLRFLKKDGRLHIENSFPYIDSEAMNAEFSSCGICENCGKLSVEPNGALEYQLCPDCLYSVLHTDNG